MFKRVFSSSKKKSEGSRKDASYSSQSAMTRAPPPGKVTSKFDPHHEVWKPQHSSGDQSEEGRLPFFNSGFAACPRCGECNIWRFEEKAGVRPNGDTFGTEIFVCQTMDCSWTTSFKYDDAGACPHFESRNWPRGVQKFPVTFMMMWADKHKLSQDFKHRIFSEKVTGDCLLELEATGMLRPELGLSKKELDKVRKALHDPRGAQLNQPKK